MPTRLPRFLTEPRVFVRIGLCLLALGALYFETMRSLLSDWNSMEDYSHGYFIPLICLYFIWERREELDAVKVSPNSAGLPLVAFGLILFLFGDLASEPFTTRLSLLFVLSGMVFFLLGWGHLKILLFPIAFLILMIPIPSILMQKVTFPMQLFASSVATFSLQQMDIPVLREGNIIHLASTTLEVADACSGIRSLISLLTLGIVFAYFAKRIWWQRVVLVAACFPIAILINALRVSATGILANFYGVEYAQGFFHGFSGYALFVVAFALLLVLGYLMSKVAPERSHPEHC